MFIIIKSAFTLKDYFKSFGFKNKQLIFLKEIILKVQRELGENEILRLSIATLRSYWGQVKTVWDSVTEKMGILFCLLLDCIRIPFF